MIQNFIRIANDDDHKIIEAYFREALKHYEDQGELIAMQDIKYFLDNMQWMRFYVMEQSTVQVTYAFELPGTNGEPSIGELSIPLQNN